MLCIVCGRSEAEGRFDFPAKTVCSALCFIELRSQPPETKDCPECNSAFTPVSKKQKFCSMDCRSKFHAKIYSEKWRAEHPIQEAYSYVCDRCSTEFTLPHKLFGIAVKYGIYCLPCRTSNQRARYRLKTIKRQGASTGVRFSVDDLVREDGNICALCNEPVDMSVSRISKYGATIDHILPISKGGLDERSNLQLAHWICNNRKGNKVD